MSPMAPNRCAQQRRFEQFRHEYNQQRPHEALEMQTPASCYTASPRRFPARLPEPDYPFPLHVRKVNPAGEIAWHGHRHLFLSRILIGERVGLEPIDERWYTIYFAHLPLARFDAYTWTVHRLPPAHDFYIADAEEGELGCTLGLRHEVKGGSCRSLKNHCTATWVVENRLQSVKRR